MRLVACLFPLGLVDMAASTEKTFVDGPRLFAHRNLVPRRLWPLRRSSHEAGNL